LSIFEKTKKKRLTIIKISDNIDKLRTAETEKKSSEKFFKKL